MLVAVAAWVVDDALMACLVPMTGIHVASDRPRGQKSFTEAGTIKSFLYSDSLVACEQISI